ncbi:MAG TPA: hypothetical protein VK932_10095 [Kofleriaceae bacterium]|nr:hypothetical protein [Kofleriaceae bacterium]
MTLRAILACAVVLAAGCEAAGCRRKQQDDPAAVTSRRDRCRVAVHLALGRAQLPDVSSAGKAAEVLVEACASDGWSEEQVACLERAQDPSDLSKCQPTAAQQERLRARFEAMTSADAGTPAADAPGLDAAPEAPAVSPLEARVLGYAKLLAIDVSIFQTIAAYPGAPKGTTFETSEYEWRRPRWRSLDAMQQELEAIRAPRAGTPRIEADAAVQAYADQAAAWLPRLTALAAYHDGQRFVDDEFDRGRKEAPDVRRAAAELGELRAPMRTAVFGAWRDLVAGHRDTPRAAVAHAWMACMSIADGVMAKARPEAITRSVSECRRSIPRLAEIASASGFDADVRRAATDLGDWVAQGYPSWRTSVSDTLGRLTQLYLDLWPKLPASPAERPAP